MNPESGRSAGKLDNVTILLKLYVSSAEQRDLAHRIDRVLKQLVEEQYLFVTIDIRVIPKLAEMDKVAATPTLVKDDLQNNTNDRLVGVWQSDKVLKRFLLGMHVS